MTGRGSAPAPTASGLEALLAAIAFDERGLVPAVDQ